MRIAYGVHGYGRGHAMRALAVLPELARRHKVLVLAGGDAYDALSEAYDVVRIPHFRYYYARPGKRSNYLTAKCGLSGLLDLKLSGHGVRMVMEEFERFRPDVVLSDSDAWTLRAACLMKVPRISFDHYGILLHCRPPVHFWGRVACRLEGLLYRILMGYPERVLVTAFFDAPPRRPGVAVVGSILRPEVRAVQPEPGSHLLVYFSSGRLHFTPAVEAALQKLDGPVIVYNRERGDVEGNLDFRPLDNRAFIRDLAAARAVFSTAGNQLIGEAMYFGKPVLVVPEDTLEQHVNADTVERLDIGRKTTDREVSAEVLQGFLAQEERFAANIRRHFRDGVPQAVASIERFLAELSPSSAQEAC